jgi:hypothetical protein
VSFVDVRYSSASAGRTVYDFLGIDSGNNTNWVFLRVDTGARYWVA